MGSVQCLAHSGSSQNRNFSSPAGTHTLPSPFPFSPFIGYQNTLTYLAENTISTFYEFCLGVFVFVCLFVFSEKEKQKQNTKCPQTLENHCQAALLTDLWQAVVHIPDPGLELF